MSTRLSARPLTPSQCTDPLTGHSRLLLSEAGVASNSSQALAADEIQASWDVRSGPLPLVHPWRGSRDARQVSRASVPNAAVAESAKIVDSERFREAVAAPPVGRRTRRIDLWPQADRNHRKASEIRHGCGIDSLTRRQQ